MSSFVSSGSVTPGPIDSQIEIVVDPEKGRCLQTKVRRRAGEILYVEKALLYSSYDESALPENSLLLQNVYGQEVYDTLGEVQEDLADLDKIECLDTARNFLQLIALMSLKDQILDFPGLGFDREDLQVKMELFQGLMVGSQLNKCVESIKEFRQVYPAIIPQSISDEEAGFALGVLNNNQLELEEFGGSGLFVFTAILEHDCGFNCCYSTVGDVLYMTSVRDIEPGERLSIDYGNYFYSPTAHRKAKLLDSYGFTCQCEMCTGPDRKRAFVCQHCAVANKNQGITCPVGSVGIDFSACSLCSLKPDKKSIVTYLKFEQNLSENPPESMEELGSHVQQGLCHESHHLYFSICDILTSDMAEDAKRKATFLEQSSTLSHQERTQLETDSRSLFDDACKNMGTCLRLLDQVLPLVHPEKVIYYDRLGQLAVCAGNRNIAQNSFTAAYQMSVLASGREAPMTKKLLILSEKTPQTRQELIAHYNEDAMEED